LLPEEEAKDQSKGYRLSETLEGKERKIKACIRKGKDRHNHESDKGLNGVF
jgi:hypothetical protein